jgi:LacI family transcriptional regulator
VSLDLPEAKVISIAGIDFKAIRSRTTIADVARRAGVSTSSVSRHLKGQRVSGAEAIEAAMIELDYRPSAVARSLKSGRTHTLGLVVPDVTNPFFAGVVKGAESVAQGAGYQLVLCNTDETSDREHDVLSTIRDRIDGLLLAPARDDAETAESLAALGVPVVLVDRTLPDPGDADAVLIDNAGGAAAAARLLIDSGHRRIAFVSGPLDTTPGGERHDGFMAECEAAGLEVLVEVGDFKEHGGYQAAMRLFAGADPPTGAFAANNLMTVGLLRALRDLGLAVPRTVSVVGFDDHLLADLLEPPLSVIDRDEENQGAVAMRMLLARLSGDVTGPGRTVRLDTRLVQRASTIAREAS